VDDTQKQELLSGKEIGMNACESLRVTFRTLAAMTEEIINRNSNSAFDASLVLELLRRDDDENAITRITVPLVLVDLDFTARPSSSSSGVDDTWSPPPISFTDNDEEEDESCATSSSYRIIRVICRTWNNIMGDGNSEPSPNDGYDWSLDDDGTDAGSPSHDDDGDDDSAPSHDDDDDSSTSHYDDDNPPFYDDDDDSLLSGYDDDDSSPSHHNDDDSAPPRGNNNNDDSSSVASFSSDDDDVVTTTSGFSEFLASLTSDTIKYAFIGGLMGIVFLFFIIGYICFASGSDEREAMHFCTSYLCSRRTYQTWWLWFWLWFFGKNANKRTYMNMESESEDNAASDGFYDEEVDEEGVVDGTTTHIRNPWLSTELKKLENHQPHDRLDPVPPPAPPSIS